MGMMRPGCAKDLRQLRLQRVAKQLPGTTAFQVERDASPFALLPPGYPKGSPDFSAYGWPGQVRPCLQYAQNGLPFLGIKGLLCAIGMNNFEVVELFQHASLLR